jgi:hypothetical protein
VHLNLFILFWFIKLGPLAAVGDFKLVCPQRLKQHFSLKVLDVIEIAPVRHTSSRIKNPHHYLSSCSVLSKSFGRFFSRGKIRWSPEFSTPTPPREDPNILLLLSAFMLGRRISPSPCRIVLLELTTGGSPSRLTIFLLLALTRGTPTSLPHQSDGRRLPQSPMAGGAYFFFSSFLEHSHSFGLPTPKSGRN